MDYVSRQFIFLAKKFRKELRKAQESLHRDLTRLSDRLKNLKDALDAQRQTDDRRQELRQPIAVANFGTDAPIRMQPEPKRSRIEWAWVIFKGALEVLGIVAVIGYTVLTYELWQENTETTNFAGRQTELARKSLNETIKNFRIDERAWLVPSFQHSLELRHENAIGPTSVLVFELTDKGKTPAKNIEGAVVLDVLHTDERFVFANYAKGQRVKVGVWGPDAPYLVGVSMTQSLPNGKIGSILWTDDLKKEVVAGNRAVVGYGRLGYDDIFGKAHQINFCQVIEASLIVKPIVKGILLPEIYSECAKANGIDPN